MRLRKRTLLVLAIAFLVAVPVIAAQQDRSIDPSYPYAVCENCHAQEGYLPVELVPIVPAEVKPGQEFNVSLVVVNPWEHNIRQIDAALNLSLAQDQLSFTSSGSDDTFEFSGSVPCCEKRPQSIRIRPGISRLLVNFTGSPGFLDGNEWAVTVTNGFEDLGTCQVDPAETPGNYNGTCNVETVGAEFPDNPAGEWSIVVELEDSRNASGTHDWSITGRAEYNTNLVQHKTAAQDPDIQDVGPFGQQRITWQVRADRKGEYTAVFQLHTELYHDHETFSDSDSYFIDDQAEFKAAVGDEYIPAETEVGGVSVKTDTTAFMRSWGKVTGFASVMMILPSFLFVGVFSKQNKFAMNRFFGSARNRVVWHSAVSWIIILLAVVHTLLFLLEPRFDEFDFSGFKFVTGWTALGFMFALGVTGLWQIPFTKKLGYKWWRRLHMYMGFAAFAFSIVHTIWDGEDFAWLVPETSRNVQSLILPWLAGLL